MNLQEARKLNKKTGEDTFIGRVGEETFYLNFYEGFFFFSTMEGIGIPCPEVTNWEVVQT